MLDVEELVGSAISNDISVNVDNEAKLGQFPQVDLGESGV